MVAHAKGLQLLRAPSSLSVTTNAIVSPNPVEDSPSSTTSGPRSALSKAKAVAAAVSASDVAPPLHHQDPSQQQQQPPKKKKKSVRFNKTIYNRRIPHLNDLSLKLRHEIWIQPEEYQAIRNRCVVTVKMMMRGDLPLLDEGVCDDDQQQQQQQTHQHQHQQQHCVRGLEGKTRDGSIRRKQYKHDSIAAVLDEQQYYWENITNSSSNDSDQQQQQQQEPDVAIMEAYKAFTSSCAQQAQELANCDEEFVRRHVRGCEDDDEDDDDDDCVDSDDDESQYEYHDCDAEYMSDDDDDDDMSVPCVEDIVEKLSTVVSLKGQRAAMLFEIERNFYEESSIGRCNSDDSFDDDDDDEHFEDEYSQQEEEEAAEAESVPSSISSSSSSPSSVSSYVSMALSLSSSSQPSSPPSLVWDDEEDSSCMLSSTSSKEDVGDDSSSSTLSATFPSTGGKKIHGRQSLLMDIKKRLTFTSTSTSTSTSTPATATAELQVPGKKKTNPILWGRKSTLASKTLRGGSGHGQQGLSASLHL